MLGRCVVVVANTAVVVVVVVASVVGTVVEAETAVMAEPAPRPAWEEWTAHYSPWAVEGSDTATERSRPSHWGFRGPDFVVDWCSKKQHLDLP